MRARGVIFAFALAALFTQQAHAAESPDSSQDQRIPTEVQGLTVVPARDCPKARRPADPDVPAPKLVGTFPAAGAVVKPGILILRLTFDLPMTCPVLLESDGRLEHPCPPPLLNPVVSKDRRTFLTTCVLSGRTTYGVVFTAISMAGHTIGPLPLTFSTSGDSSRVRTIQGAIAEDPFLLAMAKQAPEAVASLHPDAAESADSTVVQGLVIQGRLSTVVRGLVVTPSRVCLKPHSPPDPDVPAPKLVSSFPANGAVVKPGIIIVRLTFDLPMACAALIEPALLSANPCPAPLVDPVISRDRRTFMTVCAVQPNGRYGIWLNSPPSPTYVSGNQPMLSADRAHPPRWTNLAGHELAPRQILFTTSGGEIVRTIQDAIAEDPVLRTMMEQGSDDAVPSQPAAPAAPSGR